MGSAEKRRILIIDDDHLSRDLLSLLLKREGHDVVTAESGNSALDRLRKVDTPPEVILVDLQMPGISGTALAGRLRESCGLRVFLIAMSGSSATPEELSGFDIFLRKPFTTDAVQSAISNGALAFQRYPKSNGGFAVLDTAAYDRLKASMKPDRLIQFLAMCLDDTASRIEAIREAARFHDDAAVRRQAHAIKGSCGMMGALELQSLAASIEDNGLPANHVATLEEFVGAIDRLRRMLIAHKITPDPSAEQAARRSHA
jgi:CheY-like chemotaxis protein/HPt (histidine-containing phosphotransfer) domain-containing protein